MNETIRYSVKPRYEPRPVATNIPRVGQTIRRNKRTWLVISITQARQDNPIVTAIPQ